MQRSAGPNSTHTRTHTRNTRTETNGDTWAFICAGRHTSFTINSIIQQTRKKTKMGKRLTPDEYQIVMDRCEVSYNTFIASIRRRVSDTLAGRQTNI